MGLTRWHMPCSWSDPQGRTVVQSSSFPGNHPTYIYRDVDGVSGAGQDTLQALLQDRTTPEHK
jgi:hypothetical protein